MARCPSFDVGIEILHWLDPECVRDPPMVAKAFMEGGCIMSYLEGEHPPVKEGNPIWRWPPHTKHINAVPACRKSEIQW